MRIITLTLMAALLFPTLASAQTVEKGELPKFLKKMYQRMTEGLELNDEQKTKLKAIFQKQAGEINAKFQKVKSGEMERKAFRKSIRPNLRSIYKEMRGILTPEQVKKAKELRKNRKGKKGKGKGKGRWKKGRLSGAQMLEAIKTKMKIEDEAKAKEVMKKIETYLQVRRGQRQTVEEMRKQIKEVIGQPNPPKELLQRLARAYEAMNTQAQTAIGEARKKMLQGMTPEQKAVLIAYGLL